MPATAIPHRKALLFQLLRPLTGDVLANRRPANVRAGARELWAAAALRSSVLAAGRYISFFSFQEWGKL